MDLDVGNVISLQISQIAQSSIFRLGFPSLITTLCEIQGVVSDTLIFESLSPMIHHISRDPPHTHQSFDVRIRGSSSIPASFSAFFPPSFPAFFSLNTNSTSVE